MDYDVLLFPRKTCNVCGNELDTKISINQMNKLIKFYNICNKCKTNACDTLNLVSSDEVEYVHIEEVDEIENKCCWNCEEDEETGEIGNDGLCAYCSDLYEKDGTTFERCLVCNGLIEHGNKNATKNGDQCICKVITCNVDN